jgi:hypothetical protein
MPQLQEAKVAHLVLDMTVVTPAEAWAVLVFHHFSPTRRTMQIQSMSEATVSMASMVSMVFLSRFWWGSHRRDWLSISDNKEVLLRPDLAEEEEEEVVVVVNCRLQLRLRLRLLRRCARIVSVTEVEEEVVVVVDVLASLERQAHLAGVLLHYMLLAEQRCIS